MITLALLALSFVEPYEPHHVEIRTGEWLSRDRAHQLHVLEEFGLAKAAGSSVRSWLNQRAFYSLDTKQSDGTDFTPVGGSAYFYSNGKRQGYLFQTVPDPDDFSAFMNVMVKKRGDAAQVTGSETVKTISVPPPKREPGKPLTTWQDFHAAFGNNVIAFGSPAVPQAPFKHLKELSRLGRGKHWFLRLEPSKVSRELRNAMVKSFAFQMRTKLGEKHVSREEFDAISDLVESIVFDTDEVTAWTQWPEGDQPFRARAELKVKPKSRLAGFLGELRPRRSWKEPDETQAGFLNLNVSVPASVRPLVDAWIRGNELGTSFKPAIERTEIAARMALTDHEQYPLLSGQVHWSDENPREQAFEFTPTIATAKQDTYNVATKTSKDMLAFKASNSANCDLASAEAFGLIPPGQPGGSSLLKVRLDLATWMEKGNDAKDKLRLLDDAGLAWRRWRTESSLPDTIPEESLRFMRPRYAPVMSRIAKNVLTEPNRDWTLELEIAVVGRDKLVATATVGRDLHALFLIRQLIQ